MARPGIILGLCRGPAGELAGFVSAHITPLTVGRWHGAVFSAGVFFDLGYRGGPAAARFGLLEALRFKLAHPRVPLAYLAIAVTPAPYVLHTRVMRRVYPRRDVETPACVHERMHAAARARGFEIVRPGVVDIPLRSRDHAWFERSSLRDNPDATFYVRLNPDWRAARGLLVWVPLDLPNVIGSLPRALARGLH